MKLNQVAVIVVTVLFFCFAEASAKSFSQDNSFKLSKNSVSSLLTGINSDNYGLRTSAAFLSGKFHLSEAVIPLMKMLRNAGQEDARIMAALSLIKIGDARGIYAVKQAIRFDESERVRKMCAIFYINSSELMAEGNTLLSSR